MNILILYNYVFFIFLFFVSMNTISNRNNASILYFCIFSRWKVNLVCVFEWSKLQLNFKVVGKNKRYISINSILYYTLLNVQNILTRVNLFVGIYEILDFFLILFKLMSVKKCFTLLYNSSM